MYLSVSNGHGHRGPRSARWNSGGRGCPRGADIARGCCVSRRSGQDHRAESCQPSATGDPTGPRALSAPARHGDGARTGARDGRSTSPHTPERYGVRFKRTGTSGFCVPPARTGVTTRRAAPHIPHPASHRGPPDRTGPTTRPRPRRAVVPTRPPTDRRITARADRQETQRAARSAHHADREPRTRHNTHTENALVRAGYSPGPPEGWGAWAPSRVPAGCGCWTKAGRSRRSGRGCRRFPLALTRPAGRGVGR